MKPDGAKKRRATKADWLTLWRDVAEVSAGLGATDPRLPVVLNAIATCDEPFTQNDKAGFLVAVEKVIAAMDGGR